MDVVLHIKIHYIFGELNWDSKLLHVDPITLVDYDSDDNNAWPEWSRVRVGTGSEAGDSMMQPSVSSHVLAGSNFSAFPESVEACLSEPSIEPIEPEVCQPNPTDNGTAPEINMCAYATITSPPGMTPAYAPTNVCGAQATWASRMAPLSGLKTCTATLLSLLCAPVTHEEVVSQNSSYVSHIFNDDNALTPVVDTLVECANTAGNLGMTKAEISSWFASFTGFSPCDAQGHLIDNDELISGPADPTQAPNANAGRVCP